MTPRLVVDPKGRYLRELLATDFTDAQLEIVTSPLRPQLIVAGAGSGKTSVMAARVVHAVAHHGVSPGAVLGLTFTAKAAGELAERIRVALARLAASGTQVEHVDETPTVSTYHAYAGSLVTDHALRIGREPDVRLLPPAARWQVAHAAVRAAPGPFPTLDLTTGYVTQYVLDLDAEMAEHLVDPAALRALDIRLCAAVASAPKPTQALTTIAATARQREELLDLVAAYRARKRDRDLMDFGDQVALAARIALSAPEVGAGERQRFGVVFLDEYQDTGVAQRVLLAALFGGSHPVTAVGDPCQSIYGWRGASVGNLLRFDEHFPDPGGPVRPRYLSTSFRNDGRLLAAANALSAALRAPRAGSRRPHVEVPPLTCVQGREGEGTVRVALHHTVVDEACWVAAEVAAAVRSGTAPGQVAVLGRRRADFPLLHEALVAAGLPVEVVGLGGLLTMPEVADVVAVLEVLADPTANPALVRILTGPRFRLGPRDLAALGRRAGALARQAPRRTDADDPDGARSLAAAVSGVDPCDMVALADAVESPGDPRAYSPEALDRLREVDAEQRQLRPLLAQPIVEVVAGLIRAIGLDVEVEASPEPQGVARAANLAAFLDHAARFEGLDGDSDVTAFLAWLRAAREQEDGLDVGAVSAADTVKIMTVHKAKGLEWDVVAVPGLSHGIFPSDKSRSRWTEAARVLPFALRGDRDDLPADPELTSAGLKAFQAACKQESAEEERRLVYVAVTRAKHRLIASGHLWTRTRTTPLAPSPFLTELRDCCLVGNGEIVGWEDDPGAGNPLLAAGAVDVGWPSAYDPTALQRRQAAAALVRAASAQSSAESPSAAEPVSGMAMAWTQETDRLLAELDREQGAERVVPLPASLSASLALRVVREPDEVARALARPMPRRPSPAARRGVRFHAWVEQQFGVRPLLDSRELPGAEDDVPADVTLGALQAAFAASPYAELAPVAVEAPFALQLAGRTVRGRIDAVFATDGGFEVIDWKTGITGADRLQLALYRLAWAELRAIPLARVSGAFLYVGSNRLVRHRNLPDRAELTRLLFGAQEGVPQAVPLAGSGGPL